MWSRAAQVERASPTRFTFPIEDRLVFLNRHKQYNFWVQVKNQCIRFHEKCQSLPTQNSTFVCGDTFVWLTAPVQTHSWSGVEHSWPLVCYCMKMLKLTHLKSLPLQKKNPYSVLINMHVAESKHCHVECSDVGKQLFQRRSGCPLFSSSSFHYTH